MPGLALEQRLLIASIAYTLKREEHGTRWCRKLGVGLKRARLGPPAPENVVSMAGASRHTEAAFWREHCRECGGCRLSRE